jgi:glyoxylate reductase
MNELPLVLITHTLPEGWLASLTGRCRMLVGPPDATQLSAELKAELGTAEGLFSLLTIPVTGELLAQARRLRVVSNMAVGVDNIDVAACTQRGIPVGNTPGVLTEGTADLTFALLLAAARRIPEASQDARAGRWKTWSPAGWLGADLHGASLGIIGLGKIGRAVARRALAFGMEVFYTDTRQCPDEEQDFGAVCLPLEALLSRCDFISIHTPLTPQTRGLLGESALRKMKPNAILVNTARGPIVDSTALTLALQEGWIRAAALDVTDPEPLPPEHPLYNLPNCLITPHIGSATWNTRRRMAELACQNLLAGLEGRKLAHCVNPEAYQSRDDKV